MFTIDNDLVTVVDRTAIKFVLLQRTKTYKARVQDE